MSGMLRDIILRLCILLWHRNDEIKAIIGMCDEHYEWKSNNFFLEGRPMNLPYAYQISRTTSNAINVTLSQYTFIKPTTLCLNASFVVGVWHWTVQITYSEHSNFRSRDLLGLLGVDVPHLSIGVVQSSLQEQLDTSKLGLISGSAGFSFQKDPSSGSLQSFLFGARHPIIPTVKIIGVRGFMKNYNLVEIDVPNHSLVTMEVDLNTHMLSFFVGEKKVPKGVSKLPAKTFFFGISGSIGSSFSTVFLRRVPCPTHPRAPHFLEFCK